MLWQGEKSWHGVYSRLTRRRRARVFRELATSLGAFPSLDLPKLIHLGKIENGSTCRANPVRSASVIELSVGSVRITAGVTKHSCAITPSAGVKETDLFRIFLEHSALHGGVMHVA